MTELNQKEIILQGLTLQELYQEIKRRKILHKKMVIECYECGTKTNNWEENDLGEKLCQKCYKEDQESLYSEDNIDWNSPEVLPQAKEIHEKEIRGCYWWCDNDCPQRKKE